MKEFKDNHKHKSYQALKSINKKKPQNLHQQQQGDRYSVQKSSRKLPQKFIIHHKNIQILRDKYSPILHHSLDSSKEQSAMILPSKLKTRQTKTPTIRKRNFEEQSFQNENKGIMMRETSSKYKFNHNNNKLKNLNVWSAKFITNIENKQKNSNQALIETFVCKSIEPTASYTPKINKRRNINLQSQADKLQQVKGDKSSIFKFSSKLINKRQRAQSSLQNYFFTKMKKKCLENSPHVLATIIKRKYETLAKEQLYNYVNNIIKKAKK